MGRLTTVLLACALGLLVAGCGGDKKSSEKSDLSKKAQAACTAPPLKAEPKLPPSFPLVVGKKLIYTKQSTEGPTNVVEGYFKGDVKEAHAEFLKELAGVGYSILFNELNEHDSEISWQGEGRTGQIAMREECGDKHKTYVHITSRPA